MFKNLLSNRLIMIALMAFSGVGSAIALAGQNPLFATVFAVGFAACSYRLSMINGAQESGMSLHNFLVARSKSFNELPKRYKFALLMVASACAFTGIYFLATAVKLIAIFIA
jgi:hypothetical protein